MAGRRLQPVCVPPVLGVGRGAEGLMWGEAEQLQHSLGPRVCRCWECPGTGRQGWAQ